MLRKGEGSRPLHSCVKYLYLGTATKDLLAVEDFQVMVVNSKHGQVLTGQRRFLGTGGNLTEV